MWKLDQFAGFELQGKPNGIFKRNPEPKTENIKEVSKIVLEHSADLALITDPDGDRLAVIDNKGQVMIEENTLVLCADEFLSKTNNQNPIVTNLSTTAALEEITKKYDVNEIPKTKLYKAMEFSKKKDLIARQYCNGFKDIFDTGIPAYKNFYNKWGNVSWALTGVYLTFLKKFNDSHIIRNKGSKIAINVKKEAKKHYFFVKNNTNIEKIKKKLLLFDKKLKSNGVNPGTTADLTVATLLFEIVTKKQ